MKKEIIALATFIMLSFGAYRCANGTNFEKKCETYMRGTFNKKTNTCELVIEQPTTEPEKHLNEVVKKLMGGKAHCTVKQSVFPNPAKYPFKQNVSAVCNDMNIDIKFKESLNDYSNAFINRTRDFNKKCGQYIEAAPSFVKVSDEYTYRYFEFGRPVSKTIRGYKELAARDAEKPMVCRAPVHKPISHPERNLWQLVSNCTVTDYEIPDEKKPEKQNVLAVCYGINVIFEFDNVINSKQR